MVGARLGAYTSPTRVVRPAPLVVFTGSGGAVVLACGASFGVSSTASSSPGRLPCESCPTLRVGTGVLGGETSPGVRRRPPPSCPPTPYLSPCPPNRPCV